MCRCPPSHVYSRASLCTPTHACASSHAPTFHAHTQLSWLCRTGARGAPGQCLSLLQQQWAALDLVHLQAGPGVRVGAVAPLLSPEEALAALTGHGMKVEASGPVPTHDTDFLLSLRVLRLPLARPEAQHAGAAAAGAAVPIQRAGHGLACWAGGTETQTPAQAPCSLLAPLPVPHSSAQLAPGTHTVGWLPLALRELAGERQQVRAGWGRAGRSVCLVSMAPAKGWQGQGHVVGPADAQLATDTHPPS